MTIARPLLFITPLMVMLLCSFSLLATKVLHMNLQDLIQNSDKIFRGTVLDVEPGSVEAGGGSIPITTYRLQVEEVFKGDFEGTPFLEIRMVSSVEAEQTQGDLRRFPLFQGLPRLTIGSDYLLFTTAPSSIGLSTTVGLGQGCFEVLPVTKKPFVVNGLNNLGLFRGLDTGGFPASGPISYEELTDRVQNMLEQ